MILMNIPEDFKWFEEDISSIKKLSKKEQTKFLSKVDLTIRHCIGEAVPTKIFSTIAKNYLELIDLNNNNNDWMNSSEFLIQLREVKKIFYYFDDFEVKMYLDFIKLKNRKLEIIGISKDYKINLFDFVIVQSNTHLGEEQITLPSVRRFSKQLSLL